MGNEQGKVKVDYSVGGGVSVQYTMHKDKKVSEDETTETFLYKSSFDRVKIVSMTVFFAFVFSVLLGVYGIGFVGYFLIAHALGFIAAGVVYGFLNNNDNNDKTKKEPELLKEDEK